MLSESLISALKFLGYSNPDSGDLLPVTALLLGIYASFMSTSAFRKARREGGFHHQKLKDRLQELSVRVGDISSVVQNSQSHFKKQSTQLTEGITRINSMQHQVDQLLESSSYGLEFDSGSPFESRLSELEKAVVDISLGSSAKLSSVEEKETLEVNESLDLSFEEGEEKTLISLAAILEDTRKDFTGRLGKLYSSELEEEDFSKGLREICLSSAFGKSGTELVANCLLESGESEKKLEVAIIKLRELIVSLLKGNRPAEIEPKKVNGKPKVILVVGAQSAGKTTFIARLAKQYNDEGAKVLLAPCDGRAHESDETLADWAEKIEVEIIREPAAVKSKTVAYKAIHKAQDEEFDVVLIDAFADIGSSELDSVLSMVSREQPTAPHEILLALDASLGELALEQAKSICEIISPSGLCVTKLDQADRAGVLVALKTELGLPIRYLSLGSKVGNITVFSEEEYADALVKEQPTLN